VVVVKGEQSTLIMHLVHVFLVSELVGTCKNGATPFLFLVAAFYPLNVQVQYYLLAFLDDTA